MVSLNYSGIPSVFDQASGQVFIVLLIDLLILLSIYVLQPGYVKSLIISLFSYSSQSNKNKSELDQNNILVESLNKLFLAASLATVLVLIVMHSNIDFDNSALSFIVRNQLLLWVILTFILFAVFYIKEGTYSIASWLANDHHELVRYGNNIMKINYLTSIFFYLSSVIYTLHYLTYDSYLFIIMLGSVLNLTFCFLNAIIFSGRYDLAQKMNFFLYFCTSELLGLGVIIQILRNIRY